MNEAVPSLVEFFVVYLFFVFFFALNISVIWSGILTCLSGCLTCLLRNLYAGQEAKLELNMEQQTGSKLGKGYVHAVILLI